ncbi:MAG: hypothetical protein OXC55_09495 [Chloroflexi bacterium]|nr:hypothetical protein [Chloroflexota bacterium]
MHTNIDATIHQILAEVVEPGIVTDLEPLRTRIVSVEPRLPTTESTTVESVDLTCEERTREADRSGDRIS